MNHLLFSIFIFRLAVSLKVFLFRLFLIKIQHLKIFFLTLFLLSSQILLLLNQVKTKTIIPSINIPKQRESLLKLNSVYNYQIENKKQTLKLELEKYQAALEKQANHRDVLLNLAIINLELENKEESQSYLEKARQLDPNNELFKKIKE
ncbi:MAG: hypothetical protein PVJ09_02925 [Candidatus Woesebacteria bacterium]|jgi:hypothetical protein